VRRVATELAPVRTAYYRDQHLSRHYIVVRPPSAPGKPWPVDARIRYTLPNGHRRWLVTGNPRTMDLAALRSAARAALAIADAGGDPAQEKTSRRAAWSVQDLWKAYAASPEFARFTSASRSVVGSAFTRHILPRIGNERLEAVDVPMVRRLMHAITNDARHYRRGRRLGGAGAARKTARTLSGALSWAVHEGRLERNPLKGTLRIGADGIRESVITSSAEYVRLFAAMDAMVAERKLRPAVRAFIVVSATTGARRSELQSLTWRQVDLAERRITLADSKGAKLAKRGGVRTETLSLPPLAVAALSAIQPADFADADLVFPPAQGKRLYIGADWHRIRAAAGLPSDLTLHGLRHSIGTSAVLAGLSSHEVQALLRHRNVSTSAKYVHLAEQHRARLQDRVIAHLLPDSAPKAEVREFPGVRKRR
jgi:integrase